MKKKKSNEYPLTLSLPEIRGAGPYEVAAQSQAGELQAAFGIARWRGHDAPTILYHYGSNERPFDLRFHN